MSQTSAANLEKVSNDLNQIAKKYTDGSQQLDQLVKSLDGTASQLLSGSDHQWKGLSSEAFHQAWLQRRARMQQASQLLSQGAHLLSQFAGTIDDHLLTIRVDQFLEQGPLSSLLIFGSKQFIQDGESQAQNAIITALSFLNSQLEALAEEVRDCPEEQEGYSFPGSGNDPYNKNDSGTNGKEGEDGTDPPDPKNPPLQNVDQAQIDIAKFESYSMDPNNPNNRTNRDDPQTGKWVAFQELGYDVNTPAGRNEAAIDVTAQLTEQLPESPATLGKSTQYGQRFEVETTIQGPNGKEGTLVTVWQYDKGSTAPRLITDYLKVHK